ncbi:hypothetical protein FQZ97_730080 [compost metagenome]
MLSNCLVALRVGQAQHWHVAAGPLLQERQAEVSATTLAGHAVQLFLGGIAIEVVHTLHPLGLFLRRPGDALAQAHSLIEAAGHRFLEGAAEQQTLAFLGADLLDQLIEGVVGAVVGADDVHLAAPYEQGQGRLEQLLEILVEGRFVNHHHALAAPQVGRPTGEGDDAEAGRKTDGVGLDVLVGIFVRPDAFLDLAGGIVEGPRPHGAGLDVLHRHVLVVAQVIDSLALGLAAGGGHQHVVGRLGPGQADPARLLADLERRAQADPVLLVVEQDVVEGEQDVPAHGLAPGLGRINVHAWLLCL